ncbi:transcriptional regulator domain-containing protein [Bradyrhizobium sp. CCGUVB23]|uniref:transcriptional regulator domain-containing protein n=1 Tax=Bradyrhizobium sp. CCGUVB23 TaxID=2949630 RepID=UPI0035323F80
MDGGSRISASAGTADAVRGVPSRELRSYVMQPLGLVRLAVFSDRCASLLREDKHKEEKTRMPTQYWRSPETIERLKSLERPGFALEFLRRNADYRRDFARTQRQIARDGAEPETVRSELARRWGLRFRP